MAVDTPHFAVPFALTAAGAAVVEQDSEEEIYGCVQNICLCPLGYRVDMPAFGIPYQEFANAPLATDATERQIRQWEPRADTVVTEAGDLVDVTVRHLQVAVMVKT